MVLNFIITHAHSCICVSVCLFRLTELWDCSNCQNG